MELMSPRRQWQKLFSLVILATLLRNGETLLDEVAGKKFLEDLDPNYLREANAQMKARWNYITNITDETTNLQNTANVKFLAYQKEVQKSLSEYDWRNYKESKREFQYLNIIGAGALESEDATKYTQLGAEMERVYSEAKICPFTDPNCEKPALPLDPDITEIMATSTNYDELLYVWDQWHKVAGRPIRGNYTDYVALNNKAAKLQGYGDMGNLWNDYYTYEDYSEDQFKQNIEDLWQQLKPLYIKLYTYVRRTLAEGIYKDKIPRYGRLQAHILGNMWAQSWDGITQHVLPFPDAPAVDATPGMIKQNYTAKRMFEEADKFFQGLGFDPMTKTFWDESMILRPEGREVVCHASAEEFFFGPGSDTNIREDFRIKMCTVVNQDDFVTVHHEMGHIQYFMRYKELHWVFRNGANPGFHEAIGDTIALAVSTPAHLAGLGLIDQPSESRSRPRFANIPPPPAGVTEQELNYLLRQALSKITFLPFGYLMDKWRWSVFSGETSATDMNKKWWDLHLELQGLVPPVQRSEEDFDPGAKYHIPANVEYIRYFVSYVVQFQFYEALCKEAGQYDPSNTTTKALFKCDFGNNKKAGQKLIDMMNKGFSVPWNESLSALTGTGKMDASSLLAYFKPLEEWLDAANNIERECMGWEDYSCEPFAAEYMATEYELRASQTVHDATEAQWNYETNLTDYNAKEATNAGLVAAKYRKESYDMYISKFVYENFTDESLKRQLNLLQTLGYAAMPESDQKNLSEVILGMTDQYSSSKICPYAKKDDCKPEEQIYLSPDLEAILASSEDYGELSYVWSEWRNVAAKPMKGNYTQYVELTNKSAEANGKHDQGELWRMPYEIEDFDLELQKILNQTRPLYLNLHAYARMKLRTRKNWSTHIDNNKPPIPASVLGNMWAQTWDNLYKLLEPYPDAGSVDVSDKINKTWNVTFMFQTAENFYKSLGLLPMPTTYDESSMIVKPSDGRDVVCHASAWDFYNKKDFRIKMCAVLNMEDLITIHHEQGHIQYYEQYKDQPIAFRDGANPGFHEAIGDVMALSVSTPGHLNTLGLIDNYKPSENLDMNFLMKKALEKVVFLPFAYVMDKWRWDVFSGACQPDKWMYRWMELSEQYQGIVPPVVRHSDDFDPGAKYHIVNDVEYSRYFVALVLQFQIHKSLCVAAGQYDPNDPNKPLYRCDINNSPAAGDIMRKLLQAGTSKPWRDILEDATGERDMSAAAILEYFSPLNKFLEEELSKNNEEVGWRSTFQYLIDPGPVDNTVPIVVGAVLGGMVVIVIIAYFVGRSRNRKKHDRQNQAHDNPATVTVEEN